MSEPYEHGPIDELELLRASTPSEFARARAQRAILTAAAPLLARRRRPASSWEILAGWARPSLVAASIALAIAVGVVELRSPRQDAPEPVLLDDVLVGEGGAGAVLAVLVGNQAPDADAVLAASLVQHNTETVPPPDPVPEREQR